MSRKRKEMRHTGGETKKSAAVEWMATVLGRDALNRSGVCTDTSVRWDWTGPGFEIPCPWISEVLFECRDTI